MARAAGGGVAAAGAWQPRPRRGRLVLSAAMRGGRRDFATRLRECEAYVNKQYNVEGLCRAFPGRVQALEDAKGGRLKECRSARGAQKCAEQNQTLLGSCLTQTGL